MASGRNASALGYCGVESKHFTFFSLIIPDYIARFFSAVRLK